MNQQEYWKTKWDKRETTAENAFARTCFSFIKHQTNTQNILDVGCGDGEDALFFAKQGLQVTAIDFSESGVHKLNEKIKNKQLKNVQAMQTDIMHMDFRDASFDVIYAHLSLHYFDDEMTTKIFDRLFTLLKPSGLIFVKCKSTDDALYGVGEHVGKDMYVKGHLRHFFSEAYMKEKLVRFKLLEIKKTSSVYHLYTSSFIEAVAMKYSN